MVMRWESVPTVVSLMSLEERGRRKQVVSTKQAILTVILQGALLSNLNPEGGPETQASQWRAGPCTCLLPTHPRPLMWLEEQSTNCNLPSVYRSKCSTPTSSASSAPISLVTCSKVLDVGVPSFRAKRRQARHGQGICFWAGRASLQARHLNNGNRTST